MAIALVPASSVRFCCAANTHGTLRSLLCVSMLYSRSTSCRTPIQLAIISLVFLYRVLRTCLVTSALCLARQ